MDTVSSSRDKGGGQDRCDGNSKDWENVADEDGEREGRYVT